ncbi:MAG: hypothetical protein WAK82_25340 [Streptosporangiaceae bacterium]
MADTGIGPEELTPAQWQRFGEFVRRALHAAVDDLEPQADGLEPIRAQIWADNTAPERCQGPWRRRRRLGRGLRLRGSGSGTAQP